MRTSRVWSLLAILLIASMVLAACGATPTPTPTPKPPTATPVPPTATKAPAAPTATTAPAAPTATKAPAAPTATPVPPTATKPAPTNTPVPPPAPAAGAKTMVIGSATMIQNLNPFAMPGGQWLRLARFTLVSLLNLDEKGNFLPDLAESWTLSPDGKEYTFKLRKDVVWSDGTKLTSKDVVTTFQLHCAKETGSNKFSIVKIIEGCQDVYDGKATKASGITAPDEYTFKLKIAGQNPGFLYAIPDMPIVPDAVFGKMAPKDIATSDFVLKGPNPVAGPFSVKQFVPNEWIELVANPKFYRGAPKLAGIIEKKIPDTNTRVLAFEKGEIDYIVLGYSPDFERLAKIPGVTATPYGATIGGIWVNYHLDKPNKDDPKYVAMRTKEFRQALAYAIDWEGFRNLVTSGKPEYYTLRNCYWTSGIFGFGQCDPSLNKYTYNPDKAKALLKQINWDSKWEIDFAPYGLTVAPEWEAVQQMWNKVGLTVKLRGLDPATFIAEQYGKGNYDITVLGLAPNSNMVDFYYRFRCGMWPYDAQKCPTCINLVRYCNPEFDKLVTEAANSSDPKAFEPLMKKMTQIWNEELPIIVTGQPTAFLLVGPKVDGKTVKIGNGYCWEDVHLWAMK